MIAACVVGIWEVRSLLKISWMNLSVLIYVIASIKGLTIQNPKRSTVVEDEILAPNAHLMQ